MNLIFHKSLPQSAKQTDYILHNSFIQSSDTGSTKMTPCTAAVAVTNIFHKNRGDRSSHSRPGI